jgi:hypothetical protein
VIWHYCAPMREPWVVDGVPFLKGDTPGQAVRLPSAPTLVAGTLGSLTLFRYAEPPPGDLPVGGAVLQVALDLGAPSLDMERAEAGLPPEVGEVVNGVLGPSLVRLHFAGREIARAQVPSGYRPVVALSAVLGVMEATLLHEATAQGALGPLIVTAEGGLPVHHDGAAEPVHVELAGELPEEDLTAAEVAELLEAAVAEGPDRRLGLAVAAAQLFEPAPSSQPWSLVPGWAPPGYRPDAPLRPRPAGPGRAFEVRIGLDTVLPWFAAAPVRLPEDALQQLELPAVRVATVQVLVTTAGKPVTVELEAAGITVTAEVADEPRTLRFPAPDGWDGVYSWRVDGGQWQSSREHNLIVVRPDKSPDKPADEAPDTPPVTQQSS